MVRAVKEQKTGSGVFINASQGIFIQTTAVTPVNNVQLNSNIKIWPNPVKDELTIKLPRQQVAQQIIIYNNSGELITSLLNTNTISVSKLPVGKYQLRIYFDKKWHSQIFIKQN
jgi:hypothetical protein